MLFIVEQSIKVFVPLGTQRFPFGRLVLAFNEMITQGFYKPNEVVIQSSVYDVQPLFSHYSLISNEQFNAYIDKTEVVVTHSGVNSIITCMERMEPLVIVPRLHQYGEHVDDHQLEIAELMEAKYGITVVHDMSKLKESIEAAKQRAYLPWVSHKKSLLCAIRSYINESFNND